MLGSALARGREAPAFNGATHRLGFEPQRFQGRCNREIALSRERPRLKGEMRGPMEVRNEWIVELSSCRRRAFDGLAALSALSAPAVAQQKPPNILFIMGDDIGWMQVGAYHRGLALGETPNIDRIAKEGGQFMEYYAMQSCTSGRDAFFTGMYPLRTGMIPPQLPGQPELSPARHPGGRQVPLRSRLHDRRVRQEPSWRSHGGIADRTRLPGILGLSLPPRRNGAGELPRHQQVADRTRPSRRHARTRRSPAFRRFRARWTRRRPCA